MSMQAKWVSITGSALVAFSLNATAAPEMKAPILVDSANAEFTEVVPGVKKMVLWGSSRCRPYGDFTRPDPGVTNPLHAHTHEVRLIVLKGIYTPKNGSERRITA